MVRNRKLAGDRKMRRCLSPLDCDRMFASREPSHRFCPRCKREIRHRETQSVYRYDWGGEA